MNIFHTLMTKLYWPVFIVTCLVLVALIFLYITQIDNWSNRAYYHAMNIKRIGVVVAVLGGSLYMRHLGNFKAANIIIFIPVGVTLILALGFFAIVLLYSQSGKN